MAGTITAKAVNFIEENKDRPFFLYFATHEIHVPRVPGERFLGKSQCGLRGDVVQEFDWSVGQVVDTLKRLGLADNTLLIVTSDNGPVLDDGYVDGAVEDLNGHKPAGPWRGGKYSIFEGGTRMPFLVRWPNRVEPGRTSDALIGQLDLLASLAALTGQTLPDNAGPDSINVLAALLGTSDKGRDSLVEQARGLATAAGQVEVHPHRPAKDVEHQERQRRRRPLRPDRRPGRDEKRRAGKRRQGPRNGRPAGKDQRRQPKPVTAENGKTGTGPKGRQHLAGGD